MYLYGCQRYKKRVELTEVSRSTGDKFYKATRAFAYPFSFATTLIPAAPSVGNPIVVGINHLAGPGARPAAVKFSSYNLKDPQNRTLVNGDLAPDLGQNGGVFVDYPTQMGYFFPWKNGRKAFAPLYGTINAWNQNQIRSVRRMGLCYGDLPG